MHRKIGNAAALFGKANWRMTEVAWRSMSGSSKAGEPQAEIKRSGMILRSSLSSGAGHPDRCSQHCFHCSGSAEDFLQTTWRRSSKDILTAGALVN